MSVVDLFAGPGGWSEGIAAAGLSCVGLELDADACRTRVAAGHRTVRTDVAAYPAEPFRGFEGVVASPPCQAFSMAGKREGIEDIPRLHDAIERCRDGWDADVLAREWSDTRSPLVLEPLRWTWTVRPVWLACEQVPAVLPLWRHMADVLRSWGYDATAIRLVSADYGVPQTRRRAFLLAHRDGVKVPEPTHAESPEPGLFGSRKPWVSMADALGWGFIGSPSNTPGAGSNRQGGVAPLDGGSGARAKAARARSEGEWALRRDSGPAAERSPRGAEQPAYTIRASGSGTAPGGVSWVRTSFGEPHRGPEVGSPKPEFDPTVRPCRTVNGKTGDWTRERPATSIVGTFSPHMVTPPGHRDFTVPRQDSEGAVKITLGEAAVLQGFRRDYPFQGSKSSRFQQVGNAVPPPWAAAIIGALARTEAHATEAA